ncbi:hypothetical protein LINPERHAP1_LOCUS36795 [Linum perenne]
MPTLHRQSLIAPRCSDFRRCQEDGKKGNSSSISFKWLVFATLYSIQPIAFSARILWKLRKDSHLLDEFSYEDDDVKCLCELRASCCISRTEANLNRKFLGCPLYYSVVIQRMPKVAIFSSGMISRYKKMCGN